MYPVTFGLEMRKTVFGLTVQTLLVRLNSYFEGCLSPVMPREYDFMSTVSVILKIYELTHTQKIGKIELLLFIINAKHSKKSFQEINSNAVCQTKI